MIAMRCAVLIPITAIIVISGAPSSAYADPATCNTYRDDWAAAKRSGTIHATAAGREIIAEARECRDLRRSIQAWIGAQTAPARPGPMRPSVSTDDLMCAKLKSKWWDTLKSEDAGLSTRARQVIEPFRNKCSDLAKASDAYLFAHHSADGKYPDDPVHKLAENYVNFRFQKNFRYASNSTGIFFYGADVVKLVEEKKAFQGTWDHYEILDGVIYLFTDENSKKKLEITERIIVSPTAHTAPSV